MMAASAGETSGKFSVKNQIKTSFFSDQQLKGSKKSQYMSRILATFSVIMSFFKLQFETPNFT
jgi:hypothetical protein